MYAHAGMILIVIVIAFGVARWFKLSIELSMFTAAVVAGVVHTKGLPIRHLVEGSFTYYDVCLIFITATLFINLLKEAGGIIFMVRSIVATFHQRRTICLVLLTFILLIPGGLTGAGAATVLTVGSLVGTVLMCMGVPKTRTVAIIFLCAAMSAAAPPVNLWAMMAAAGSNMPYVGFMLPLLVLTVGGALLSMFILAGKGVPVELAKVLAELPKAPQEMTWGRVAIPFVVFFGLVIAGRLWPFHMPILGLPFMFLIASLTVLLISPKKLPVLEIAGKHCSFPHSAGRDYGCCRDLDPNYGLEWGAGLDFACCGDTSVGVIVWHIVSDFTYLGRTVAICGCTSSWSSTHLPIQHERIKSYYRPFSHVRHVAAGRLSASNCCGRESRRHGVEV